MSNSKILTGEQLIEKAAQKHNVSLPELGLKEVIPNGSWLEKKQIQAALEARKQLIEVERIDKSGNLSHAVWNEELGLAEVKSKTGPHWQYVGHSKGPKLYLNPEEALFLMEVNCLFLTYNEVTVSLQQAYSLLLRGKIKILQYKVYSSLSRLGYKVMRYEEIQDVNEASESEEIISNKNKNTQSDSDKIQNYVSPHTNNDLNNGNIQKDSYELPSEEIQGESNQVEDHNVSNNMETSVTEIVEEHSKTDLPSRKEQKLQKLKERKHIYKTKLTNTFESIPEMCRKVSVKVTVPEQSWLPRNVFPNKTEYDVDLDNIKLRNVSSPSNSVERPYGAIEETVRNHNNQITWNPRFPSQRFQNSFIWNNNFFHGPRLNIFMHPFFFNRPPPIGFQGFPRPPMFSIRPPNLKPFRSRRKRTHDGQNIHLNSIKQLATKMKQLATQGVLQEPTVEALKRLVNTYNLRYCARLRLVNNFDVVDDELIETIELDDDEPRAKVPKRTEDTGTYNDRFNELKDLAQKLKQLDSKQMLYSRHRRAFSNLLKEFNKTYNSNVHLDSNYEIEDRNLVVLDSSDSDCVVDEPMVTSKKVLNPFSVLRRRSLIDEVPSTSKVMPQTNNGTVASNPLQNWLPNEDDFGKRELCSKSEVKNLIADTEREYYVYEFLKQCNLDYKNWNQVKTLFWESIEERSVEEVVEDNDEIKASLVKPDDCKDMASVLEKLRVIPEWHAVNKECSLEIHFDVYHRDVQNFKKTSKPVPHFRIICVSDSSEFPSGGQIAALHAACKDGVPNVFAVVGTGSVAFVQVSESDIPVYLGKED